MSNPVTVHANADNIDELSGRNSGVAVEKHGDHSTRRAAARVTLIVHHDDAITLANGIIVCASVSERELEQVTDKSCPTTQPQVDQGECSHR